jgi:hypothetical protein
MTRDPQSDPTLDFEAPSPPKGERRRGRRRLWRTLGRAAGLGLRWAPVWVPGAALLQFAALGLVPAWNEGNRLEAAGEQIGERVETLLEERAGLERARAMLADPIYQERLRRNLIELDSEPLLLREPAVR